MQVVIFGQGVTGTATGAAFADAGAKVAFIDPPKEQFGGTLVNHPHMVVLCVPTPAGSLEYVTHALAMADRTFIGRPVYVIRSTLPPGAYARLTKLYPGLALVLMPEFLREATAVEDARRKDKAIYATEDDKVAELFDRYLQELGFENRRRGSIAAVEMLKIALNSALAVKVAHANVLYDLAKAAGADYPELTDLMQTDSWVTPYGMTVPGRHGRGYSGTCLPKDTDWLIKSVMDHGTTGSVWLKEVQKYNRIIRNGEEV